MFKLKMPGFLHRATQNLAKKAGCDNMDKEMSDLSYEDALLDAQLRIFYGREYQDIEPPAHTFSKVLSAINANEERAVRESARLYAHKRGLACGLGELVTLLRQHVANMGSASTNLDTVRIFSGNLIAALLVLAMVPTFVQALNGTRLYSNLPSSNDYSPNVISSAVMPPQAGTRGTGDLSGLDSYVQSGALAQLQTIIEMKTGEDLSKGYQYQPLEAPTLDPLELGIANQRHYQQQTQRGRLRPQ